MAEEKEMSPTVESLVGRAEAAMACQLETNGLSTSVSTDR